MMRSLRVFVVAAAIVSVLAGCFLLPTTERTSPPAVTVDESSLTDPQVGDCWTTLDANWDIWTSWRGDPAVDCNDDHESYTYAVLDVLADFDVIHKSNGYAEDAVIDLAATSCLDELEAFVGARVDPLSRLIAHAFIPTKGEWADGARWLRCDVLELELWSSVFTADYADLPADASELADAIEDNADYFDFCMDTDDGFTGYGPFYSESAVYSPCADDPMWRLSGYELLESDYNAPFPGDDVMQQYAEEGCLADLEALQWGIAHAPVAEDWATGYRIISCWTYEWEIPEAVAPPI